MKLWTLATSLTVSLLILSGCTGTPKPADKENVVIDKSLPLVTLTKNGTIVGMKSVAFEWNSITDPLVEGIYVYKKTPNAEGTSELAYYQTIPSRFTTHYVDTDVTPDTRYTYTFRTFSKKGEGREGKKIVLNTLPVLASVSWIHSITDMPRVAKIIWRPHSNEKVKAYIIERKTLENEKWEKLATIEGRLNAEYIDEGLKDNFVYMYRLRAYTYDGITSTPSQIVKVVTKALPLSIVNIQTTRNLPHAIKITWDASTQEDFGLYYLYRAEKIDGDYELIAKLHNNTFTDKIHENAKTYFYRVSAVDKDGLESIHNKLSIAGMTLNRPQSPAIVEAKRVNNTIEIHWSQTDPRSISYTVVKTHKQGWFDKTSQEFTGIKAKEFIDKNIVPDSTYTYVVYSVDINGIKSEKSIEAKIVVPESAKIEKAPEKKVKEEVSGASKDTTTASEDVLVPSEDLDLSGL